MKILGGLAVLSLNLQDLLIKCWCWVGQDSIKYWEWLSHYYFATTSLTKYKKHFWKFLNGLDTDLDCLVFYHKIPLSHHSEKCAFTIASNLPNLCIYVYDMYLHCLKKILYTLKSQTYTVSVSVWLMNLLFILLILPRFLRPIPRSFPKKFFSGMAAFREPSWHNTATAHGDMVDTLRFDTSHTSLNFPPNLTKWTNWKTSFTSILNVHHRCFQILKML